MDSILSAVVIIGILLLIAFLRAYWFQEKPSREPKKTVSATVVSKEVKRGTHQSGRSKGGYSYVVRFLTEDGQSLDLFTYEIEYGSLKEGSRGLLTYKGRYFVDFRKA